MHTPTMRPIRFDAGWNWKLMEANGWSRENTRSERASIYIDWFNGSWVVTDGTDCKLHRQDPGEPIAFAWGPGYEKCESPEKALALAAEYLNQPLNPYLWIREIADRK
jgi:hypothetical protein